MPCRLQRDYLLLSITLFRNFPSCLPDTHSVICSYAGVIRVMKIIVTRSHPLICLPPWKSRLPIFTSCTHVFIYTVLEFFSLAEFIRPSQQEASFLFTELSVISTVISCLPVFLKLFLLGKELLILRLTNVHAEIDTCHKSNQLYLNEFYSSVESNARSSRYVFHYEVFHCTFCFNFGEFRYLWKDCQVVT